MTFENARKKNTGMNEGDITGFFEHDMRLLLQFNSGDNTFSTFSEEFHEKDIPLPIGEKTHIMLTHPNHTISCFSSLSFILKHWVKKVVTWFCWLVGNCKVFFCWVGEA